MTAIEIAIKMETDAVLFYRAAAAKTGSTVCRKMFLSVAEDERRHFDMLRGIMEEIDIHVADVTSLGDLKTVFEEHRGEALDRVALEEDELKALAIAADMEKKGIAFYEKVLSQGVSERERALFERLIREEEEHLVVFSRTQAFLEHSRTGA